MLAHRLLVGELLLGVVVALGQVLVVCGRDRARDGGHVCGGDLLEGGLCKGEQVVAVAAVAGGRVLGTGLVAAAALAVRGGLLRLVLVGEDEGVVCERRQLPLELVVEVVAALHVGRVGLLEEVVDVDKLLQERHGRVVVGAARVHVAVAVYERAAEVGGAVFDGTVLVAVAAAAVAVAVAIVDVQALEVRHWNGRDTNTRLDGRQELAVVGHEAAETQRRC